jgi:hypothetical protein
MNKARYNKLKKANSQLSKKLGEIIVKDKSDFVSMLETCSVGFSGESFPELIDAYVDALPDNNKLQVCSAYLIEAKESSNFDGKVDNDNVYLNHDIIYNYWDWDWGNDDYDISGEENSQFVGEIVKGVSRLGEKVVEARRAKETPATDMATKKADMKAQLLQAVIEQKKAEAEKVKAQAEADAKKTKTLIIAGSVVAGLVILGTALYILKRRS